MTPYLIFQGFTTPTSALALEPGRVARSEDGISNPAGLFVDTKPSTGEPEEAVSLATITKHRVGSVEDSPSRRTPRILFSLAKPRL